MHEQKGRKEKKKERPIYDIRAVKDVGRADYCEHMQTQTRPCVCVRKIHTQVHSHVIATG